ncbi:MAG: CDF family Co(II)/Ni(II) efflux transporter DmeF [Alphaproteobacteria bacterium]|nr:CDF family Co(II)/Ni(II) efflux transporter DmeF [Alphaproteobacteria bacterium]
MPVSTHPHAAAAHQHTHVFLGAHHDRNERRTRFVIALTAVMMIAEITGGTIFGSMALVADGWHMSTHAGALLISALAYAYARRHKNDPAFAFGTGKMGDLAGFSSAVILALISLFIVGQSVARLLHPVPIAFGEAIAVAALGLAVNIASAAFLHDGHHESDHHHDDDHPHEDDHHHDHHHGHHHHDNNLRAAYIHIVADAATSLLAIAGLGAGWAFGWVWMDAVMGMVGAAVIANWSYGLMRDAGRVLLDMVPRKELPQDIRRRLESAGDMVTDLHIWQIGPGHYGAIISLLATAPQAPDAYKARLADMPALSHITIEVHARDAGNISETIAG